MSLLLLINYKHFDVGGVPFHANDADPHKWLARKKFDDEHSKVIKELRKKIEKEKKEALLEEELMIALLFLED